MTTTTVKTCDWPGCPHPADRYCRRHYTKLYRHHLIRAGYVDPEPVKALIRAHLQRGRTVRHLAHLTGVSRNSLAAILAGRYPKLRVGVADKIRAVPLSPSDVGCVRRVRALARLGHTLDAISREMGVSRRRLGASVERGRFADDLADALVATYERLSGTPGISRLTAQRSARAGHAPPLAWDGATIDDPAARPLGVRVTPLTTRRRAKVTRSASTPPGGEVAA